MKKPIMLFCAMIILGIDSLLAQGFYIQPSVGYSMPLIAQPAGTEYILRSSAFNYTADNKTNYSTLGSGVNGGICMGFLMNEHLALEIGVNFVITPMALMDKSQSYFNGTLRRESEMKLSSTVLNIAPGIRFFNTFGSNQLFFRVAPVFGNTTITLNTIDNDFIVTPAEIEEQELKLTGNMAYGIFASAGFTRMINERLGISMELFSNLQHYVPAKGLVTKSILNGIDQLPNLKRSEKEYEFVDELTYSDIPNQDEPSKIANDKGFSFLLSGVGLQIGLFIKL